MRFSRLLMITKTIALNHNLGIGRTEQEWIQAEITNARSLR